MDRERLTLHRLGRMTRGGLAIAVAAATLGAPIAGIALVTSPARAQDQADRSPEELLSNFIHFVKIARYDVAAGEAAVLLDRGLSATEFVDLVEESGELDRFQSAVATALRVDQVQDEAAALDRLYRQGRLERARDPEQIARNIDMLDGTMGERLHARRRLIAAGEYAMPQLLEALLQTGDPVLRANVQRVMVDMGRQAVRPLAEALLELAPGGQERVLNVLASINYRAALPDVLRIYNRTDSNAVRAAAARVINQLDAGVDLPAADAYEALAEGYYEHRDELTSFPQEDFQLMWDFQNGLVMRAVPTEVYHETMAMRMSERALRLDPSSPETLALWIASAFGREIDGADLENLEPVAGRDAMYYAVAAGPITGQRILARALDDRDTPLARRAIAAIERTAGVDTLTGGEIGRRPLLQALTFHSRRVQYDAALALARSQPEQTFEGAERVVPILASAIRNAGERYAVVLSGEDREEYDRLRAILEDQGYTVLPPADGGIADLAGPIAEAPGIDLIVASMGGRDALRTHDAVRAEPRLAAAPMLILARPDNMVELNRRFYRDETVMVRRDVITNQQLVNAVDALVEQAIGGAITEEEAREYTRRALAALRDLAVARNPVLSVEDAALPLIAALEAGQDRNAPEIAEVIAYIAQPRAQVALMDAALDAAGDRQTTLLNKVAESAKRFGNMLEDRQVRRLIELAQADELDLATAAAAVIGALDLPNADLVPLITGSAETMRGNRAGR